MKIKDVKLTNATLLNEGISNESYLIDNKYVFRYKEDDNDVFNKAKNEKIVLTKIKDYSFVEKVIDYDDKTGQKLSLYIENTTRLIPNKEQIKLVADVIKMLHEDIKVNFSFKPFKRLYFYRKNVDKKLDKNLEKTIINKTKELYKKYPIVFSHNDLVKGNMLFVDNKLYLLDFEYAGNNIELFDIASFISENNIEDIELIDYFISQFNVEKKDVMTMIDFANILWYYWAQYNFTLTKKSIFKEIAIDKLNHINNI